MPIKEDSPVVFISYAWSTVEHDNWIIEFSTRLSHSGVFVILDKWDLAPGQDKYAFMEKMVRDEKVKSVLMICDKNYKDKADGRRGGVGTETQIISNEVYSEVDQKKFIPILKEKVSEGNEYLPIYLKSRIYIDFSSEDIYEEGFEKLLRLIYDKPDTKRPVLGVPPAYLFETDSKLNKTISLQKQAVHAFKSEKKFSENLLDQFLNEVITELEEYSISYSDSDSSYDEKVLASIKELNFIRDQILELIDVAVTHSPDLDLERIVDFFGNLNVYFDNRKTGESYREIDFDNFRYFGEELFLSVVGLLVKKSMYNQVKTLIYGPYFPNHCLHGRKDVVNCSFLNHYIKSFDEIRNTRLNSNLISVTSEIMNENVSKSLKFGDIIVAEILIFNATLFNSTKPEFVRDWWYPRTHVYIDNQTDLSAIKKLVSINHFEKVKGLFKVSSRSEMINKNNYAIKCINDNRIRFGYYNEAPLIQKYIDIDKIATV